MWTMQRATIKRIVSLLCVMVLALSPARADFGSMGGYLWGRSPIVAFRGTCSSLTTDLTTYAHNGISLGIGSDKQARVAVIALGEDSATVFGVNSMTVDGNAAGEAADQGGTGIVNAAVYVTAVLTGVDSVDISVTYSEAITSSVVCAWAFLSGTTVSSSLADEDTASGALVLDGITVNDGYVLAACVNSGVADAATWTGVTEQEDTQSAEIDYSSAEISTRSGASWPASAILTCDWTGANDAAGARIILRPYHSHSGTG